MTELLTGLPVNQFASSTGKQANWQTKFKERKIP